MFEEPALEAEDIQGHILIGFGSGFQRLIGLRFRRGEPTGPARRALSRWVERVTPSSTAARLRAERREARTAGVVVARPTGSGLNVAMSFSSGGLAFLAVETIPEDTLFQQGAYFGASSLGDAVDPAGRPIGWVTGDTAASTPDVFVVLASGSEATAADAQSEFLEDVQPHLETVYCEAGHRLPNDTEHFGFVDGISQPGVRGLLGTVPLTERLYPAGNPLAGAYARPGQALVWPGQFVFGYPTQRIDDLSPGDPIGDHPLLRNGSLLVFRRLRQDVAAFQSAMASLSQAFTEKGLAVDADTVAAWCMGRWPDGTPVSLSADGPNPAISGDSIRRNGFWYDQAVPAATLRRGGGTLHFPGAEPDPQGAKCPFFAHIRKVNPRDRAVDQGSNGITLRSQMLRRGIPYGPAWPGQEDGQDRGLLFMAYQTSIRNQFFRLTKDWINNGSAPPPGEGVDPIIGVPPPAGRALTRRPDAASSFRALLPGQWVTATGAGYFFAPGIQTLRQIIDGSRA